MVSDHAHTHTRGSSRYTTPLAAPPPPLHLLSAQQGRGTHNMHLPAYAGARHTLGPMFNDEEDGDDSAFIAQQMALLGLDQQQQQGGGSGVRRRASTTQPGERTGSSNNNRRGGRRQQQQQGRAPRQDHHQQQQAASAAYLVQQAQQHALLAAQMQMQIGAAPPSHQAQILAAQQYQMELQLAALQIHQQQQQQNGRYVSSPSPNPQYTNNSQSGFLRSQRSQYPPAPEAGNRQAQDNSASRARRQNNLDDAETRARFEAAPNVNRDAGRAANAKQQQQQQSHPFAPLPLPASSSNNWRSSSAGATSSTDYTKPAIYKSVPGSRFAQPPPVRGMSGESSSSDSLQASTEDMYSLMSTEPTTAHTSPKSAASDLQDKLDPDATPSAMAIGLGRPLSVPSHYDDSIASASASARLRAWSSPVTSHTPLVSVEQPRGASNPVITSTSHVIVVRQPFGPPGNARDLQDKNFKAVLRKRAGLGLHMLNRRSSPLIPIIALEDDE